MKDTTHDMLVKANGNFPEDTEELRAVAYTYTDTWKMTKKKLKFNALIRDAKTNLQLLNIIYRTTISGNDKLMKMELRSLTG
jgi:hypothetical protein